MQEKYREELSKLKKLWSELNEEEREEYKWDVKSLILDFTELLVLFPRDYIFPHSEEYVAIISSEEKIWESYKLLEELEAFFEENGIRYSAVDAIYRIHWKIENLLNDLFRESGTEYYRSDAHPDLVIDGPDSVDLISRDIYLDNAIEQFRRLERSEQDWLFTALFKYLQEKMYLDEILDTLAPLFKERAEFFKELLDLALDYA